MRRNAVLLLLFMPAVVFGADPDLKEAQTRLLHGNFDEAKAAYETLLKGEKSPPAAAIGLSRVHQSVGEYDQALAVIEAALKKTPSNADLLARQAEVLFLRGLWDAADKAADKAIIQKDEHFLARWVRAQILRDRGEWEKADEAFRWFVRTYTQRSNDCKEITNPEELALVGRAAVEYTNAHYDRDQFYFILNTMYKDALKEDKDAWYIELQAGELMLEKYNRGQALDAFDNALKINPRAAEAIVGKAQTSLQMFEIKEAEQFADQALKINPKLPSALRVKADLNLMGRS